ncbi:MAG: tetratricopeptide repeat protein [Caulobacteraceae bacterium]
MKGFFAALIVSASLSWASAAAAQTPIDDTLDQRSARRLDQIEKVVKELRAIVFQGRDTGQPIVVQPAETESRINSLADRLDDLDRTLARLNGQIEIVRHDLDEARKQDLDLATRDAALQGRVAAVEQQLKASTLPPPPPPPDAIGAVAPMAAPGPAATFAAARAQLAAGDAASAEAGFRDFVDRYGDTPRGPEARYYLGRALMVRKDWPEAATAEIGAIRGWPRTVWAPRAILDLSRALHEMGKDADACQTLGELARRYPNSVSEVRVEAGVLRRESRCG